MKNCPPLTSYFQPKPTPIPISDDINDEDEVNPESESIASAIASLEKITKIHRNAGLEKRDPRSKFECIRHLCVLRFLQKIKANPRSHVRSSKEVVAMLYGESKGSDYKARCIRIWSKEYVKTQMIMPYRQGKHQKSESLIDDPDVRRELLIILRGQRPELIEARSFVRWISEQLHCVEDLALLQPVQISERTARRWLHLLGFRMSQRKQGTYIDGHERPDVVSYRAEYSIRHFIDNKKLISPSDSFGLSKFIKKEWINMVATTWKSLSQLRSRTAKRRLCF